MRVTYALICVFTHKATDRVIVYYGRRVRSVHIIKVNLIENNRLIL